MQYAALALPPLEDFSASQLKDLFFAFTKSPEGIPKSKSGLLEQLKGALPDSELTGLIARLEARQPFRHVFLLSFNERVRRHEIVARATAYSERLRANASDSLPLGLHVLDVHAPPHDDTVLVRLAHCVSNYDLRPVSATTMEKVRLEVRHPIVIAAKPDAGLVEIRFNGFDQTKYTPAEEKVSYLSIAEACAEIARDAFQLNVGAVQLARAVDILIEKYPNEIVEKRMISRTDKGRVAIEADEAASSSNVAGVLRNALSIDDPSIEVQKAMASWTKEYVTLSWERFGIYTRLDLTLPIPEIMFLWRTSANKSWQTCDEIMRMLTSEAELRPSNVRASAAIAWAAVPSDAVVVPFEFAQRASIAQDDALQYLLELVAKKIAQMRFRIRTSLLPLDGTNDWRESLAEFPHEVVLEDRSHLNLVDLKNIEVGFVRAGEVA
ncbi:hypothetical protein QZN29_11435 [Burkholderia multivorans]|uniref:hypothetical protein n=1 Tax=Burkholderia multivorans TaxID=87883 RepID=UPI0021C21928|nr:hypothetical protein [Burkholderia multivorans]MDN8092044.1 hypothetical protein [Burkholderia multivorans]MDN8097478.1 hypothetical protein [Burkholderia multivorans]MDN8109001.1 hypothetical protein [Burkholderia multivorans]MDN8125059.1 hypothetical protein [Burkholderia multivorans]MDN8132394.1 hypothetical protein [Burkholderia multivorans]